MKSLPLILFISSCSLLLLISCNKNDIRDQFVGDWVFQELRKSVGTTYTSTMGGVVSNSIDETTINWTNYNGSIRKGDRSNELVIYYGKKEKRVHAFVHPDGILYLKDVTDYEKLQFSPVDVPNYLGPKWNVSSTNYSLYTYYFNGVSGFGGGTVNTTQIVGYKK